MSIKVVFYFRLKIKKGHLLSKPLCAQIVATEQRKSFRQETLSSTGGGVPIP